MAKSIEPIIILSKEALVSLPIEELKAKEDEAWVYWKRINRTIEFLELD